MTSPAVSTLGVLVAAFHVPEGAWESVPDAAAAGLARAVDQALAEITARGGQVEGVSPLLALASFPDLLSAVEAGLAIARTNPPPHGHDHRPRSPAAQAMVGVGWGPTLRAPSAIVGGEVSRAWRLATVATAGEVLLSDAARGSLATPPGVGLFRMPAAREPAAGAPAYVLVDYRDPAPSPAARRLTPPRRKH